MKAAISSMLLLVSYAVVSINFVFMLGHGAGAWTNPAYPQILANGIHWAAGK